MNAKERPFPQQPHIYTIKVEGRLQPAWSDWFSGMEISVTDNETAVAITTLVGPITDQAALRGILTRIWNLNLNLISVNLVEADLSVCPGQGEHTDSPLP